MNYLTILILNHNPKIYQELVQEKTELTTLLSKYEKKEKIISPIPHTNAGTIEEHPSANYNFKTDTLRDWPLNKTFNSVTACQEIEGIPYSSALKLTNLFKTRPANFVYNNVDEKIQKKSKMFRYFSLKVLKNLQVNLLNENEFKLPVFMHCHLLDIRHYNSTQVLNKMRSDVLSNTPTGLIIPFDIVNNASKNKALFICEGEKDMLIARTYGLNAICITGGAQRLPEFNNNFFKGRNIFIIYDNDEAGRKGGNFLGNFLLEIGANCVRIFDWTKITAFVPKPKEDLFDFFTKYDQTVNDLFNIFKNISKFKQTIKNVSLTKLYENKKKKFVSLNYAKQVSKTLGKTFTVEIQVISTYSDTPTVPTDFKTSDDYLETPQSYRLHQKNLPTLLKLIGNEKQQYIEMKNLLGLRAASNVPIDILQTQPIYIYDIFDFRTPNIVTCTLYTLGKELETGKKYVVDIEVTIHPKDMSKVVFLLKNVIDTEQDFGRFVLNQNEKDALQDFQVKKNGTVKEKMEQFFIDGQRHIGNYISKDVFYLTDLTLNSVLEFECWNKTQRGALDILMIGATRVGKSETVRILTELYGVGSIMSLKNTSEKGLIGGSNPSSEKGKGYKICIGVLTQNHKGFLAFEELQGCDFDFHKAITDVRGSGIARIARVGATLSIPTVLRKCVISNPKMAHLEIEQYSSGIPIIEDLVKKPEDVSRYDLIGIINAKKTMIKPKTYETQPKYSKESYETRIKWVWSRKANQVKLNKEVLDYLWIKSLNLNKLFSCTQQIIGRETPLKLARVSISVAAMLCSTDETFTNIIVKKEHVEWAHNFIVDLYSSENFKLDKYVRKQREFKDIQEGDFEELLKLYECNEEFFDKLSDTDHFVSLKNLTLGTEIGQPELDKLIQKCLALRFLKPFKREYIVTYRFKQVYKLIEKKVK